MPRDGILTEDLRSSLQKAAESATICLVKVDKMTAARKHTETLADDDSVFDDADALIALAQASFTRAAQDQVAENDRRGIPTHGAVGGKLTVRQPRRMKTLDQH